MARISRYQSGGIEILAALDLIAWCEIGTKLMARSDDGYNVLVGATWKKPLLFDSYAKHPNKYNKKMDSTAAGRYQHIFKTWEGTRKKLMLPDFSPESQDLSAVELIRQRKATKLFIAGDVAAAIYRCKEEWASFPGSDADQPEKDLASCLAVYAEALAKYASPDFSNVVAGVESTAPKGNSRGG